MLYTRVPTWYRPIRQPPLPPHLCSEQQLCFHLATITNMQCIIKVGGGKQILSGVARAIHLP